MRDKRARVAAVADELAERFGLGFVADDDVVGAWRRRSPVTPSRASPRGDTLPWMTDVNPSCA